MLFSTVNDPVISANELNQDLKVINHEGKKKNWNHKISFIILTIDQMYKALVRSYLDYCDTIYHIPALNNQINFFSLLLLYTYNILQSNITNINLQKKEEKRKKLQDTHTLLLIDTIK